MAATTKHDGKEQVHSGNFECAVCLETADNPVVTRCGHLFCWQCLYRWIQSGHNTCPICKAGVSTENVVPIYGRGTGAADHAHTRARRNAAGDSSGDNIPERPTAQRVEAEATPPPQRNGFFGEDPGQYSVHQTYFGGSPISQGASAEQRVFVSRLFLLIGALIILILLFQ